MRSTAIPRAQTGLRDVDALAQAVHHWVRQELMEHRFRGTVLSGSDEQALAAGFLAGLRGLLSLEDQEAILIAYAYCLKSGIQNPVALADELTGETETTGLDMSIAASGYVRGREAARVLLGEDHPTLQ